MKVAILRHRKHHLFAARGRCRDSISLTGRQQVGRALYAFLHKSWALLFSRRIFPLPSFVLVRTFLKKFLRRSPSHRRPKRRSSLLRSSPRLLNFWHLRRLGTRPDKPSLCAASRVDYIFLLFGNTEWFHAAIRPYFCRHFRICFHVARSSKRSSSHPRPKKRSSPRRNSLERSSFSFLRLLETWPDKRWPWTGGGPRVRYSMDATRRYLQLSLFYSF